MNDSFKDVFKDNFVWLKRDADASRTLYRSAFSDLARELCCDGTPPSPGEAKDVFWELCGKDAELFAQFCLLLTSKGGFGAEETTESSSPKRVSYLRSQITDRAFSIFSKGCGTLSAVYGADFKNICEDVYYERCDACILPLESSADGLLMSFRNLLLKYELYIFAVCEVRQNDDSVLTLSLLTADPRSKGGIWELYFPSASAGTLEDINIIVKTLGGTVSRCSTVTSEYSHESDIHLCAHFPKGVGIAAQYCFDALYPSHMVLGKYSNFNKGKE